MKKLFLSIGLALALGGIAQAKTPPEVLKPYKEYRAALEAGEETKAYKAAKKAWETAEKMLGDHKTTGDLAQNYAMSPYVVLDKAEIKRRIKAHKRAVELASFYEDDARDVYLSRHIDWINTELELDKNQWRTNTKIRNSSGKFTSIMSMEEALISSGQTESEFSGILTKMKLNVALRPLKSYNYQIGREALSKKEVEVIQSTLLQAENAEKIFLKIDPKSKNMDYFALMASMGEAYLALDNSLQSALAYQKILSAKKSLTSEQGKALTEKAETGWRKAWISLWDNGLLENAKEQGLCHCLPDLREVASPLIRIPPIMPARADRSGEVILVFDVNKSGRPENIRVGAYTEKKFVKAAEKSVEKWRYLPAIRDENPSLSKNISTNITFKLTDEWGKIMPKKKFEYILPKELYLDSLNTKEIVTTGRRVVVKN